MGYPKILHDNRLDDATPVASTTAAGDYNVLNLRDFRPYTWWKPTALPATVTVNCAVAKAADYALIHGHSLVSSHAAIEVRGSTDNFVASDVKIATSNPVNYNENMENTYWGLTNLTRGDDYPWSKFTLQEWHATVAGFNSVVTGSLGTFFTNTVLSIYAKKNTHANFRINLYDNTAIVSHYLIVNFDGSGVCTFGSSSAIDDYGIDLQDDGVYRIWLMVDGATRGLLSNNMEVFIYPNSDETGTTGTYFGGPQVNAGTAPAAYQSTSDDNDRPLLLPFTSASYRYWRFRIWQMSGAVMPSLAIASLGAALEVPSYMSSGFDPIGRKVIGQSNRSEGGQPLGRVIDFEEWREALKFEHVSWSWLRNSFNPAWAAHLRSEPFGFCWDAENYADEVRLVQSGADYKTPHRPGALADLSLEVFGVV